MTHFTIAEIANYWRVLSVAPDGGRKIVSTHSTRKGALRAQQRAASAQPSPQQVYRDLVESVATEPGAEV